jgi:hypothetical protein
LSILNNFGDVQDIRTFLIVDDLSENLKHVSGKAEHPSFAWDMVIFPVIITVCSD